ncbi:MAG: hypothetical protein KH020_17710 [Clostridiales bacterium]|nr:hypothetical protein [Clostridiales bacterium]
MPSTLAVAEEVEKYPYSVFGRNGITVSASSNLCINGNIHTNKEADISYSNGNINGKITTGNDIEKRVKHVYSDQKIMETYFTENCDIHEEEYVYSDMNIHINNPLFCYNNITLNGNVSLNSNLGTYMNLNITGEVKNANTSVVYSKYGDITIENDSTANINGLIYAPLGTLTINSPNINLNGVIIADKIVINGSSVNINYKDDIAQFIGNISEAYDFSGLEYLPEDWLGDTDEDGLFDIYEKVIDTDPLNPDTDGDGLPDGYEVITLNTDPLEIDTDENGISDADEDFDNDNLNNLGEYQNLTEPFNPDTDDDGFLDGDEVYTYNTDPLNPDTDNDGLLDGEESYDGSMYTKYGVYFDPLNPDTNGNGILDGDEVFGQSKQQSVETYDETITDVKVDMDTNGNIERNLSIESMYNIDAMSTNVYAMIGEPFNFTSSTNFKSATITFKIDQSKLGDTLFDNLIILWYNEEDQVFEEMPTTRDAVNSTVSTTTTHFSQYMVVDSQKWYANWNNSLSELRKMWTAGTSYQRNLHTILMMDCSSSAYSSDPYSPSLKVGYNGVTSENIEDIRNSINSQWDAEYYCVKSCDRFDICDGIINNKGSNDAVALITFAGGVVSNSGWIYSKGTLRNVLAQNMGNYGGIGSWRSAISTALSMVKQDTSDIYRIVIISDTNANSGVISSNEFASNVILNVVNVGTGSFGNNIEEVAQATGGDVYNAISASDLTYQTGGIITSPEQFIGTDSDGDGIPDIVELYGLKPNGEPINTDPNKKDTDGDGIDDNVELGYIVDGLASDVTIADYVRVLKVRSDPTKADTDGDDLIDINDPIPNSTNNYSSEMVAMNNFDNVATVQKCLEFLGYLDMQNQDYGTFGGLTIGAVQLFQLNHRMFSDGNSFKCNNEIYYIDMNTYYAIIKEAQINGFVGLDIDTSWFNTYYTPTTIPLEEFNASLNPDNPIIVSSVLRKNYNNMSNDRVNIYIYDYTEVLRGILRYGAQEFHFHNYNCSPSYIESHSFPCQTYDNSSNKCAHVRNDYLWMILQVKNNAPYDVKTKSSWNDFMSKINVYVHFSTSSFPFLFSDRVINAEVFGNILYGFSGHAGGFSEFELEKGGSAYSFITTGSFDNTEDSTYVKYGYELYDSVSGDYSYLHVME